MRRFLNSLLAAISSAPVTPEPTEWLIAGKTPVSSETTPRLSRERLKDVLLEHEPAASDELRRIERALDSIQASIKLAKYNAL